jgi:hypothetical protein
VLTSSIYFLFVLLHIELLAGVDYKENSKKFWSFIKSRGQEWTGVAPLKNKMGFLQSDNKSKAKY